MSVSNYEIAEVFSEIADLLEFQDENPFRVRAYRNAARTIGESARSLAEMVERGEDLSELPGIGKDLAGKVAEIVRNRWPACFGFPDRHRSESLADMPRIMHLDPR